MKIQKIAINGFGRIGRNVLRAYIEYGDEFTDVKIVAINDVADPVALLHLFKYDSTHGSLRNIGATAHLLQENGTNFLCIQSAQYTHKIALFDKSNPMHLPWHALQVDVVLECTGRFREYDLAVLHTKAGARQVIIGAAPFDAVDASIVLGVNEDKLRADLPIISSVSCTTQALVPLLFVLDNAFGVQSAMLTEIHAVTADQTVLDSAHRDLRRARASGYNIIPTTSSSIAATVRVLPKMANKLAGHSIRVPTLDVAAIDVSVLLDKPACVNTINQTLQQACMQQMRGIMAYCDEPLVSSDFVHNRHSLVVDGLQTMQAGAQFKIFAWYDNEWGYANRLLQLCQKIAQIA